MNSTQEAATQVAVSTFRTRVTCPSCGRTRKGKPDRKKDICRACRYIERQQEPLEPGDALVGGHWVGGLVKRWVELPIPWTPTPTHGFTCSCGCLLLAAEETCPACMAATLGSSALAGRVAA